VGIEAECASLAYLLKSHYNHIEKLINGYLKLFSAHPQLDSHENAHIVRSNLWNIINARDSLKELLGFLEDTFEYTGPHITGIARQMASPGNAILCCIKLSKTRDKIYDIMTTLNENKVLSAFYSQALIVLRDVYNVLLDITGRYCRSVI